MMIKDTYKFELIVEIDGRDIAEYNDDIDLAIREIRNTMNIGLICIDGLLSRQFKITNTESYVHSITDEDGNEY
jgi:hypothetical protein